MARPSEHLPIRTLSTLTGVNTVTLRAWERRHGLLTPPRTAKGHRLYTHEHVEQVRRVQALLERGVPISQVRGHLEAAAGPVGARPAGPWKAYLERMSAAIARFDEAELDLVYDEALSLHPTDRVTRSLTLPLLAHLGERWDEVAGGVAEEHFFATYLRSKLGARLQHRLRYPAEKRLLAACLPGEHHEVGLLLFALEAQEAGMRAVVLGANTPLEQVAVAQQRSACEAVVLSSSVDPSAGVLERDLARLVASVDVPVFVGGPTAVRQRKAIVAAGAKSLGTDIGDGVRLIRSGLEGSKR
jgi:DNA-binding transcriptional MerR regulator/methylmalonyl-CoA mutase cobalamin-binding subunit